MTDVFKEQIVKRKQTGKDTLIRIGLIIAVILIFFITFQLVAPFAVIITAAAAFGAFFLMSFRKIEYEYVFTNGELDIDIIYNRSRRKRVLTVNVKSFDIMAHVEDMNHAGSFNNAQETRDFSSGETLANTYAFLVNKDGKQLKVIIEPNEKMLAAISNTMSRSKLHVRR